MFSSCSLLHPENIKTVVSINIIFFIFRDLNNYIIRRLISNLYYSYAINKFYNDFITSLNFSAIISICHVSIVSAGAMRTVEWCVSFAYTPWLSNSTETL